MTLNETLPPQYTTDAVKCNQRTSDEEQTPPAAAQTNEILSRIEGKEEDENRRNPEEDAPSPSSSKGKSADKKSDPQTNTKKKKPASANTEWWNAKPTGVTVFNITGSKQFHIGGRTDIQNTYYVVGDSSRKSKPQDEPQNQNGSSHSELPNKLFKCLKAVTEGDCIHMSDKIQCKWEELGELLFFEDTTRIEQYRADMTKLSRKEAVQFILKEWRLFAGSSASVARLSRELLKLNEIDALKKLAKRHHLV